MTSENPSVSISGIEALVSAKYQDARFQLIAEIAEQAVKLSEEVLIDKDEGIYFVTYVKEGRQLHWRYSPNEAYLEIEKEGDMTVIISTYQDKLSLIASKQGIEHSFSFVFSNGRWQAKDGANLNDMTEAVELLQEAAAVGDNDGGWRLKQL